eukprot:TRINITY_DN5153_c0_g1_i10.p1 TRINITY_DN5153_c0_g1~~TRINITY_DN5153_c0_g1_i10.p1  ORF type:complete len:690 (+),score=36.70 TRINITY_DN5153_c0_g1_i10:1829-3898(+)
MLCLRFLIFRHCPPHEKLDEFMERVRTLLQEEFDTIQPQNISDLTVALAQFQYKPQQDILSFIKDYAKKNAMEFSPRQAYHVLLGLTIFDVYDSDLMGVLEDEWEYDLGTSKLMDQESMIGFYLLFLSYFQHFGDEFPDTLFQHPFTAKSRDLWLQAGKMWPEVVKNDPIVQEISSIFRKIGVLHQVGYFDEEYEISMDIKVLSQQGGSDCAILIYGEGEVFVNEPDRIRGESMLIKQHIENSGYETVAINAHDWHLLGNEQLRTAFLQQWTDFECEGAKVQRARYRQYQPVVSGILRCTMVDCMHQSLPQVCFHGPKKIKSVLRQVSVRAVVATPCPYIETEIDEARILKQFKVTTFSCARYVCDFLSERLLTEFPKSRFIEHRLCANSARLAKGSDAVIIFVNDDAGAETLHVLRECGVKLIAFRCAGFDRIDMKTAKQLGIKVVRVPTYSPTSVAEHAVALLLAVIRNLTQAYIRVMGGNFTLSGLTGFELHGKTVGVIGTGAIGTRFCKIMLGFGCRVLASDLFPSDYLKKLGVQYVDKKQLYRESDVISLHCPLLPSTYNLIDREAFNMIKDTAILINVSRGGLVDTDALIEALQNGKIGGAGLDVYEYEHTLFFQDQSILNRNDRMKVFDSKFAQLRSFPNVVVTPHSAFLTEEALNNIAATTIDNLKEFALGQKLSNEVNLY